MSGDLTNTPPGDYEYGTRVLACVALGEAMAANVLQFQIVSGLVASGLIPRVPAIEMVDTAMLRIEQLRATMPTGAADHAILRLRELMELIASDRLTVVSESYPKAMPGAADFGAAPIPRSSG